MRTTKIFMCGNSRAIRLPKEIQFSTNVVEIFQRNGDLVIRPVPGKLTKAFELLSDLPPDFFAEGRKDDLPQTRDSFE